MHYMSHIYANYFYVRQILSSHRSYRISDTLKQFFEQKHAPEDLFSFL